MRHALGIAALALLLAACGSDGDATVAGSDGSRTTNDGATSAGAPIPGGGLTVEEAIDSELDGPLMVSGFLFVENDIAELCDAILESYPPQCGGASLVVEGLDLETVDGLERAGDRAWTDERISLLGDVENGTIRVSSTST